jgi:hypothetical protein
MACQIVDAVGVELPLLDACPGRLGAENDVLIRRPNLAGTRCTSSAVPRSSGSTVSRVDTLATPPRTALSAKSRRRDAAVATQSELLDGKTDELLGCR